MTTTRNDIERKIEAKLGFLPDFYRAIPDAALPGAWGLHEHFELAEDSALDPKTKELIGLAMASHIKCKYCMYFHTRTSETFGASEQEILEAIAMGGVTVLFSNAISGAQTDFEQFKRDVDRAIENLQQQAQREGRGEQPTATAEQARSAEQERSAEQGAEQPGRQGPEQTQPEVRH